MAKIIPFPIRPRRGGTDGGSTSSCGYDDYDDYDDQPLLATIQQTCQLLNCGRTTVFDLLNQGVLERVKIGRATRVTVRSIYDLAE